jgi:hypothetical protein
MATVGMDTLDLASLQVLLRPQLMEEPTGLSSEHDAEAVDVALSTLATERAEKQVIVTTTTDPAALRASHLSPRNEGMWPFAERTGAPFAERTATLGRRGCRFARLDPGVHSQPHAVGTALSRPSLTTITG